MNVLHRFILMIIINAVIATVITIKLGTGYGYAYAGGQLYMGLYFEIFKTK